MTEFGVFNNDGKNAKWQIKRQTKKTWQKLCCVIAGKQGRGRVENNIFSHKHYVQV